MDFVRGGDRRHQQTRPGVGRRAPALLLAALAAAAGAAACGDGPAEPLPADAPALAFVFPLAGTLNQDFFYTNYVDLSAGTGAQDYMCGPKSYRGHSGLDLVLPSFARMDEGLEVVAAAAGRVASVRDGMYDRNRSWAAGGGFGNHVVLSHDDGYQTIYAHLMSGSLRVAPGDPVEAGDVLGLVGSSGMSDMPHLHFEVRREGAVVEPYAGDCNPDTPLWRSPHPYQADFRLIAADLTAETLDLDRVKDPPGRADVVAAGQRVTMWVHLQNVRAGTAARWELRSPAGELVATVTRGHHEFYSMSWWWAWFTLPEDRPGTWSIEYHHGPTLLARREFQVVDGAPGPVAATPGETASASTRAATSFPTGSPAGSSGGALQADKLKAD